MPKRPRIYLDNAATSWPKPAAVYDAVDRYQREVGASAGRSGYREAAEAERIVAETRKQLAWVLGAEQPQRVVFTYSGTDSLNLALYGALRPGDHVVTSVVEHNSLLRPLRSISDRYGVEVTRVTCGAAGVVDPADFRAALRPNTRMIAIVHASNVTGALQPIDELARIAHEADALLLVDACQSAGQIPINVTDLGVDLLATSGHKGLLGPLGTGVLYIGPRAEPRMESVRQGGTGTESESDRQPRQLPYAFEAGNHNVPGLAGLGAGALFVRERTAAAIHRHEVELLRHLMDGLSQLDGVTLFGPPDAESRTGVLCFTIAGFDPHEAASALDASYGIQVRAGLHCAPLMHQVLGTAERGGTVRISVSPLTPKEHIDAAIDAVSRIAAAARKQA